LSTDSDKEGTPSPCAHSDRKVKETRDRTKASAVVKGAFRVSALLAPLVDLSVVLVELLVVVGVGTVIALDCALSRKTTERLGPGAVNEHPFVEQPVRFVFGTAQLGLSVVLPSVTPGPHVSPPQEIFVVSDGVAAARNLTTALPDAENTDEGSANSVDVFP